MSFLRELEELGIKCSDETANKLLPLRETILRGKFNIVWLANHSEIVSDAKLEDAYESIISGAFGTEIIRKGETKIIVSDIVFEDLSVNAIQRLAILLTLSGQFELAMDILVANSENVVPKIIHLVVLLSDYNVNVMDTLEAFYLSGTLQGDAKDYALATLLSTENYYQVNGNYRTVNGVNYLVKVYTSIFVKSHKLVEIHNDGFVWGIMSGDLLPVATDRTVVDHVIDAFSLN